MVHHFLEKSGMATINFVLLKNMVHKLTLFIYSLKHTKIQLQQYYFSKFVKS